MLYGHIDQAEAQRLIRGDLLYVEGFRDDIFQVDLTPRQDMPTKVRLHSYKSDIVRAHHDTILVDEALKKELQKRRPTDFKPFDRYFEREGLSETDRILIRDYLQRLCNRTGHLWKPGNCRAIPGHTEEANDELKLSKAKTVLKGIVPKRCLHWHFFWVSMTDNGPFVIDPTGTPDSPKNYQSADITPFFGFPGRATGYRRSVYEKMQDMDDWGTREFPPGFHP